MSEEEKEAIETLKIIKNDETIRYYYSEKAIKSIDIVLNIIEKQQKEIEELKEEFDMKKVMLENMPEDVELIVMYKGDFDRNFGNDYIGKDKIKAKIKDLENKLEVVDNGYYSLKEILQGEIKMLQELLEGE